MKTEEMEARERARECVLAVLHGSFQVTSINLLIAGKLLGIALTIAWNFSETLQSNEVWLYCIEPVTQNQIQVKSPSIWSLGQNTHCLAFWS